MTGPALMFRSCPACRGLGKVQIPCAACSGKGSAADVAAATRAVLKAWERYTDGRDGSLEDFVDALSTLERTVKGQP